MPRTKLPQETIQLVAEKVLGLIKYGNTAPSYEDIYKAIKADASVDDLGRGIVLASLLDVRDLLQEEYDTVVVPVSEKYYTEGYDKTPPTTEAQAEDCMPIGYGNQTYGLHLPKPDGDGHDLIFKVFTRHFLKVAAGIKKSKVTEAVEGVDGGYLTPEDFVEFAALVQRRELPEDRQIASHLRKMLGGTTPEGTATGEAAAAGEAAAGEPPAGEETAAEE